MTPNTPVARLSGPATRWLHTLQDLGHIDAETADRLVVLAAEHQQERNGSLTVELPVLRSAAATLLFPDADEDLSPMLKDDWALFFG